MDALSIAFTTDLRAEPWSVSREEPVTLGASSDGRLFRLFQRLRRLSPCLFLGQCNLGAAVGTHQPTISLTPVRFAVADEVLAANVAGKRLLRAFRIRRLRRTRLGAILTPRSASFLRAARPHWHKSLSTSRPLADVLGTRRKLCGRYRLTDPRVTSAAALAATDRGFRLFALEGLAALSAEVLAGPPVCPMPPGPAFE
jgi:hypothetical protein